MRRSSMPSPLTSPAELTETPALSPLLMPLTTKPALPLPPLAGTKLESSNSARNSAARENGAKPRRGAERAAAAAASIRSRSGRRIPDARGAPSPTYQPSDPATGVAVYAPTSRSRAGWVVFGGTSVAAPLIAGVYGVRGTAVNYGSDPYNHTANLYDITSGSNGSCGGSYLCTAKVGYDGPTGLGTPHHSTALGQ